MHHSSLPYSQQPAGGHSSDPEQSRSLPFPTAQSLRDYPIKNLRTFLLSHACHMLCRSHIPSLGQGKKHYADQLWSVSCLPGAEPLVWRKPDPFAVQADATFTQASLTGEHPLRSQVFPQSDGTASGANTLKKSLRCHGTLVIVISRTQEKKCPWLCRCSRNSHVPNSATCHSLVPNFTQTRQ